MNPPVPPNPNNTAIYLRFKRLNQTVFLPCESTQPLQLVKERLAELLGKDEDDLRLYEHLSQDKRAALIQQILDKQKEAAKASKKNYRAPQDIKLDTAESAQIPPLDCAKKVWELGLDNDQIVLFVFRTSEYEDNWEMINVPGVYVDPRQFHQGIPQLNAAASSPHGGNGSAQAGTTSTSRAISPTNREETPA